MKPSWLRLPTIFADSTNESHGPWNDRADEQLVIENHWSAFLVRINLDMFLLETCAVVGACIAELPIRVFRLCEFPFLLVERWPRRLYLLKVGMRVALD